MDNVSPARTIHIKRRQQKRKIARKEILNAKRAKITLPDVDIARINAIHAVDGRTIRTILDVFETENFRFNMGTSARFFDDTDCEPMVCSENNEYNDDNDWSSLPVRLSLGRTLRQHLRGFRIEPDSDETFDDR